MPEITPTDLSALVALDALLQESSVTRAAKRLGLSTPAVSHALARLRERFGDELLVRSGRAMVLTAPRSGAGRAGAPGCGGRRARVLRARARLARGDHAHL